MLISDGRGGASPSRQVLVGLANDPSSPGCCTAQNSV
jgi:hypothetical protein